jgi:hypothetical protein
MDFSDPLPFAAKIMREPSHFVDLAGAGLLRSGTGPVSILFCVSRIDRSRHWPGGPVYYVMRPLKLAELRAQLLDSSSSSSERFVTKSVGHLKIKGIHQKKIVAAILMMKTF